MSEGTLSLNRLGAGEELSGEMMKQTVEVEQLPCQGIQGDSGLNV